MENHNYLNLNKNAWNTRTDVHVGSEFYDIPSFLNGKSSLNSIELELLGDVTGKKILHLQCHFGQDTLSLARMGAHVTGVDFSDKAIDKAHELSHTMGLPARFICCDVYDLHNHLDEQFDIVFTSYGTIGWLPDLDKWAKVIERFLKPGGTFVFAEFHPLIWIYDNNFERIDYSYFTADAIIEIDLGTYADTAADIKTETVSWNHGLGEVINSLIANNIEIKAFNEYDYSPYNCFNGTEEYEPQKFRIAKFGNKIPMVYSIKGMKK